MMLLHGASIITIIVLTSSTEGALQDDAWFNPLAPSVMYLQKMSQLHYNSQRPAFLQDVHWPSSATVFNSDTLTQLNKQAAFYNKSTEKCISDMMYIAALSADPYNLEWAKKFADSSAKEPSGSMRRQMKSYGDFDQCIAIPRHERYDQPGEFISPQFCYVGLIGENDVEMPPLRMIMQMFPAFLNGICISSNCAEADIPLIMAPITTAPKLKVNLQVTHCQKLNLADEPLSTVQTVAISIFSIVGGFMVLGLLVDIGQRLFTLVKGDQKSKSPPSLLSRLIIAFSPLTNFEKLATVPAASTKIPNLSAVNGIRALSLFWIMLGHLYYFMGEGFLNASDIIEMVQRFTAQFLIGGYFAVDTFLFLSGFLGYWSLSRRLPTKFFKFLISLPYIYFHRWIRIAPPYYALILVDLGLWIFLHNGPFYFQGKDAFCESNWWSNLVFINNFYESDTMCVPWSWYLAVDMQCFILVPLVVYAFVKTPVIFGWALAIAGLAGNIVSSAVLTAEYHIPPSPFQPPGYAAHINITAGDQPKDYSGIYKYFYAKPYTRMGPYVVGIICCHLLVRHQNMLKKAFNNLWFHLIGWPISFATMLAIIYAPYGTIITERIDPEWVDVIYNGFARIGWGVALGWIVLAAAFNRAGIVGQILSWNFWAIPARLSYSAYLLHPLVYLFYIQTQRTPFYFTDITAIYMFCGSIVTTLMVSTLYSLAFESPVMNLTR